jgi:ElaB/YqjD/DUF883 family membrane-anchored ribosome-binding protein
MASPYPDSTVARSGTGALGHEARGGLNRLKSEAHGAVDYAASVAASASDRVASKGRELSTARDELMEAARGYVREHPFIALRALFAAGYLLTRPIGR